MPCIVKNISSFEKNVTLHWKTSKFLLIMQSEALRKSHPLPVRIMALCMLSNSQSMYIGQSQALIFFLKRNIYDVFPRDQIWGFWSFGLASVIFLLICSWMSQFP